MYCDAYWNPYEHDVSDHFPLSHFFAHSTNKIYLRMNPAFGRPTCDMCAHKRAHYLRIFHTISHHMRTMPCSCLSFTVQVKCWRIQMIGEWKTCSCQDFSIYPVASSAHVLYLSLWFLFVFVFRSHKTNEKISYYYKTCTEQNRNTVGDESSAVVGWPAK